ncbi:MAG: FliM/FliN family flagellar motor switch protein [Steroidobacteraceae bacterium]
MAAQPDLFRGRTVAVRSEQPDVREYEMPDIAPAARDAINTWLRSRTNSRFTNDTREFELDWIEPSYEHMRLGMQLQFGGHAILLAFDGFAAIDPLLIGEPFELMPTPLRDLAMQRTLGRFLTALPSQIADAADVRSIHWSGDTLPRWQCMVGFTLRRLPQRLESQAIIAAAEPEGLQWLHARLPVSAKSTTSASADLPVPFTIVIGRALVEISSLRNLDQGDVIWVQTASASRTGLTAQLSASRPSHEATGRQWTCRIRHASLEILTSQPRVIDAAHTHRRPTMNGDETRLEIPITFDLGELRAPVQELEQLQPGHLFELPQPVGESTVYLRASGEVIAEGQLVTIGKRIGVRIARVRIQRPTNA